MEVSYISDILCRNDVSAIETRHSKPDSLNRLATSAFVVALTLGIAFVSQPAQKASAQVTSSNYRKSCFNIKVEDGDLLSATCITRDGRLKNASIHILGIKNINGLLTFNNPNNSSSWMPKPGSR